jgi:hypothetical protein
MLIQRKRNLAKDMLTTQAKQKTRAKRQRRKAELQDASGANLLDSNAVVLTDQFGTAPPPSAAPPVVQIAPGVTSVDGQQGGYMIRVGAPFDYQKCTAPAILAALATAEWM